MGKLVRFGVSIYEDLLKKFDKHLQKKGYNSRSKGIIDLMERELANNKEVLSKKQEVVAVLNFFYEHRKRELVTKLLNIQHKYHQMILTTQHVHLSGDWCLEFLIIRGKYLTVKSMIEKVAALKGVRSVDYKYYGC